MGRFGLPAIVVLFVVLANSWTASATTILELTGSHAFVLPNSGRVVPGDPSVAFFNPALLPWVDEGFSVSSFSLGQLLDIDLDQRPAGADISAGIYDARLLLPDGSTTRLPYRPLATEDLRSTRGSADPDDFAEYIGIGTVLHFIPERLAFGLHAIVPLLDFQVQQAYFPDEREQFFSNSLHFELLGDRTRVNVFSAALAGRPLRWLSVGAGVTMSTAGKVRTQVYVPDVTYQETADINTELGIDVRLIPHFSLAAEPLEHLLLSASVHLPYRSQVAGRSELQMWNYPYAEGKDSLDHVFEFTYGYEPLRVALGGSFEHDLRADLSIFVAGQVRYARWSDYLDRHGERPADAWSDTVSGSLGGGLLISGHRIGLECGFSPSPVPEQTGRSNYVDNHRVVGGAGWEMPLALGPRTLRVGINLQVQRLLPQSVKKSPDAAQPVWDEFPDTVVDMVSGQQIPEAAGLQTNNPGYPGFGSSGWLVGGGVFARTAF